MRTIRRPVNLQALVRGRARVKVEARTLFAHEPEWRRDCLIRGAVVLIGLLLLQPILVAAGILLFVPIVVRYAGVAKLMQEGEALPARLVSSEPLLVAAYGDLSRDLTASYPILVVMQVAPHNLPTGAQRGDRLAAVGLGFAGDSQHYLGLSIRLLSTANADPAVNLSVLDSISEWDWESLDNALLDMGAELEPGTHLLRRVPEL